MQVDERLLGFVVRLRDYGIEASIAETMDAFRAVEAIPLHDGGMVHAALRATLVKKDSDYPVFDAVFNEYFFGHAPLPYGEVESEGGAETDMLSPRELAELLERALAGGSEDELAAVAVMVASAVGSREGGFKGARPTGIPAGVGYYMFRAMEMLSFSRIAAELEALALQGSPVGGLPPVLALEALRQRIKSFQAHLEKEVRRRLARARPDEPQRARRIPPRPEEVEFTGASLAQIGEMKKVLPVLARKLAARLARKQSAGKRGRVDIRNTLRHSVSTGGVPLDLKYRKRAPSKPELVTLCDISGSVRTFSTFTLQLVYSLHSQFRSVRSFVFVDRVDEVTEYFNRLEVDEAVARVYREAKVVDGDGHSDVGRALDIFASEFGEQLSHRSTVLVLSDARNNARDPRAEALERISRRARRVYWLNPEPRERWDSGDSIMHEYQGQCDSVHEVRNLRQLSEFVYRGA